MVVMADMAASILAKLKNKAKGEGIPLQQLLNLFCQEEFIRDFLNQNINKILFLRVDFYYIPLVDLQQGQQLYL